MKSRAQTAPLVAALIVGVMLMSLAYGAEDGMLANRWSAAILAALVIVGVGGWFYHDREAVDMEKAGDGCYYLGLIFTLFSLIVVLSGFGDGTEEVSAAERTNEVISKFGVALASTLAGVAVRVFLQSCAPGDDSDGEGFTPERARAIYGDALSLATRRTLRELRNAEASFSRLARSALMQAEAMERRAGQAGTQAAENAAQALDRMASGVERVAASIEKLRQETIEQRDRVRAASADTKDHVEDTRASLAQTVEHVREVRNTARELQNASWQVNTTVREVAERLEEAGTTAATQASEAVRTLQRAAVPGSDTDRSQAPEGGDRQEETARPDGKSGEQGTGMMRLQGDAEPPER